MGVRKMIKVYGSKFCPDCVNCELNFKTYGIEFEYFDINEGLRNLKKFLILRDSEPVFERLKAIHDIGIPACVDEDGTVFTDWESYVGRLGHKVISGEPAGKACSINGKGC